MRRVVVKTLGGKVLGSSETPDPNAFIAKGIMDGKWGDPAQLQFLVEDITQDRKKKDQILEEKRKGLIVDYAALNPRRMYELRKAIDIFMLENFPIDVERV